MHPTLTQEVARFRQADMRREAALARQAHQLSVESKADEAPRRARLHLRRRAISFGRPVLGQ